jgi:hypothetical protein
MGWHFSKGREAYGKQRPFVVGKTYKVRALPRLCRHGLHASARPLDALGYGSGPIVCRVRLSGTVVVDTDKAVGTARTVLAMADATTVLQGFACWCAEGALVREREAGREPDPRSWAAIEAKRRWLRGEIDDKALGVAWEAARLATATATEAALGAAAAAREAASVREAQNAELERRLNALLEETDA